LLLNAKLAMELGQLESLLYTLGISNFVGAFNNNNFPDLPMTAAIFQLKQLVPWTHVIRRGRAAALAAA